MKIKKIMSDFSKHISSKGPTPHPGEYSAAFRSFMELYGQNYSLEDISDALIIKAPKDYVTKELRDDTTNILFHSDRIQKQTTY
jgi:hypothetical protein